MATSLMDLLYEFLKKITSATSGATEDMAMIALLSALDPTLSISAEGGYIKGQYDIRTDLSPADGGTATLNYSLGNAFRITAPDTGAGMDFTITISNFVSGSVVGAIEVNIVVGTNVPTISLTGKGTNVTLPTLTASRNNVWVISTWDNGTTLQVNSAGVF